MANTALQFVKGLSARLASRGAAANASHSPSGPCLQLPWLSWCGSCTLGDLAPIRCTSRHTPLQYAVDAPPLEALALCLLGSL